MMSTGNSNSLPDISKQKHLTKKVNKDKSQNIQVYVRCRPHNPTSKNGQLGVDIHPERREVFVRERLSDKVFSKTFTFDQVFSQDAEQVAIYNKVVLPLVGEVLEGYTCTVFAYGQTGTGKTYTMEGERSSKQTPWEDDPIAGIIPRALHQLFHDLEGTKREYNLKVSFLELYNEELFDLLTQNEDTQKIKLFEAGKKGSLVIQGQEEISVSSKEEVYNIIERGIAKRQTAATLISGLSSRSHTIFSITVHVREDGFGGEELLKIGKLNLVDLAGSENIGRSGSVNRRAREAGNINQSMLILGRVITALVEKSPHVPYRESKLTRLLQESLGGRTKTSVIATISPSLSNLEETLSTLEYALSAKAIVNHPEANQKISKKGFIAELATEMERLRRDLAASQNKNGIYLTPEDYYFREENYKKQLAQLTELEKSLSQLNSEHEATKQRLGKAETELFSTQQALSQKTEDYNKLLDNAYQIQGQAKESKGDLDILHEKQTQKDRLRLDNLSSTREYHKSLENSLQLFHKNLTTKQEEIKSYCESLRNEFGSLIQNHKRALEDMGEQMAGQFLNIHNIVQKINTDSELEETEVNKQQSHVKTTISNDLKETKSNLKEILEEKINNSITEFFNIFSKASNFTSRLESSVEKMKEAVPALINKKFASLSQLEQDIKHKLSKYIELVDNTVSTLSSEQQQLLITTESTIDTELSLVQSEKEAFVTKKNIQKQESFKSIKNLVPENAYDVSSIMDNMELMKKSYEHDMVLQNESDSQTTLDKLNSLSTILTEDLSNHVNNIYNSTNDHCTYVNKTWNNVVKNVVANYLNLRIMEEDSTENVSTTLEEVNTEQQSLNNKLNKNLTLNNINFCEDLKDLEETEAKSVPCMQTFITGSQRHCSQAQARVDNFVNKDFTKDIPTGQTPKRKTFSIQQVLSRTNLDESQPQPQVEIPSSKKTLESSSSLPNLYAFQIGKENTQDNKIVKMKNGKNSSKSGIKAPSKTLKSQN